jgi:hypothetical protein
MGHSVKNCCRHFHHRIVCRHQIEIEVFPGSAEAYFADEQYADPIQCQVRFDAIVLNAPSGKTLWSVKSPAGGPGKGSIDETGLYVAPPKGGIPSGWTDVIVASSADDASRTASAFVTLVGKGPAPAPVKRITISPQRCTLYLPAASTNPPSNPGFDPNRYIDASNTRRIFTAILRNCNEKVRWKATGVASVDLDAGQPYPYTASTAGVVRVRAELVSDAAVFDEALVSVVKYDWPNQQRDFERS